MLYDAKKSLSFGSTDTFSANVQLPLDVDGYTAIGVILSRAYFLTLVAEVCCCLSNPKL